MEAGFAAQLLVTPAEEGAPSACFLPSLLLCAWVESSVLRNLRPRRSVVGVRIEYSHRKIQPVPPIGGATAFEERVQE